MSADSSIQRTATGVTVTFGESATGTHSVSIPGKTAAELLRGDGFRETAKWRHGSRELGVVATKTRWERKDGTRIFTSFRVRDDVPVPLWNSTKVAKAGEVWLSESNSDAEALCAAGVVATTNWQGATDWNDDYAAELRGKQVIVVQHKDEAGRDFVKLVRRTLPDITVVEAASGNDARDHLEAGLSLSDFMEVV